MIIVITSNMVVKRVRQVDPVVMSVDSGTKVISTRLYQFFFSFLFLLVPLTSSQWGPDKGRYA